MAAIRFELGVNILQFSKGIRYPVEKPIEKMQVVDQTAAGTYQVEDLGVTIRERILQCKNFNLADYNGLVNWYDNICNGAMEDFTYYDENSESVTVFMKSNPSTFQETSYQRFAGTIILGVLS